MEALGGRWLTAIPMEYPLADVRPEFLKGIASHASKEAPQRPHGGIAGARFTVSAPCVRQEVVPGNGGEARKGRAELTIGPASSECHQYGIADAPLNRTIRGTKIAGVLSPQAAQSGFHRVPGRNSGEAHSIAFAKSFPGSAVFSRTVSRRTDGGGKQARSQALGTNGALYKPFQALFACDRLMAALALDDDGVFADGSALCPSA